MLELKNVSVISENGKTILDDISTKFNTNSINLVLGPNAAGKSTLAETIAGKTDFEVKGKIFLKKEEITKLSLDQRARLGIFLAYQNPVEIPGVNILNFLHSAYKSRFKENIDIWDFHDLVVENMKDLKLKEEFLEKNVNEGLSGGEKKKFEILQMKILKPQVCILDEIDSGLDVDSVKDMFESIKNYKEKNKSIVILISHSPKILQYVLPDKVFLLMNSKIQQEGDVNLAKRILKHGYEEK